MDCELAEQGCLGVSRPELFLEHPSSGSVSIPCVPWFNPSQNLQPSPNQQNAAKRRVKHKVTPV